MEFQHGIWLFVNGKIFDKAPAKKRMRSRASCCVACVDLYRAHQSTRLFTTGSTYSPAAQPCSFSVIGHLPVANDGDKVTLWPAKDMYLVKDTKKKDFESKSGDARSAERRRGRRRRPKAANELSSDGSICPAHSTQKEMQNEEMQKLKSHANSSTKQKTRAWSSDSFEPRLESRGILG